MNESAPFSPHQNFADNLRALCTRHGSIAAVCRALGMNRQQFNKYLAGSVLPNPVTLERICAFFNVESESLFHDPRGFRGPPPRNDFLGDSGFPFEALGFPAAALAKMQQSSMRTGCYNYYCPWPRDYSKCLRAAIFIYRKGGSTLFSRFTKFRPVGQKQRYYLGGRHDGIILESDKANYMLSLNRKGFGEMSLVSLGVENAASQDFLSGLALVMGTSGTPMALRATLEYRGATTALRRTIADAGILPISDPSIPEEVRQSVSAAPLSPTYLRPFSLLDSLPASLRS